MKFLRSAVAVSAITSLTIAAVGTVPASATTHSETVQEQVATQTDAAQSLELSEDELNERGLTKDDAKELESDFASAIDEAERNGSISSTEAQGLRTNMLGAEDPKETDRQVLPVWAAAAIVGCAGSIAIGEGKSQVKNALKNEGVDSATDIAIGIGVDCVFGAIPGGVIGAAAKKAMTTPIKQALKPHVKKVVETLNKSD